MLRMQTVLAGIAGRQQLASGTGAKGSSTNADTLERLERCEAFAPGELPVLSSVTQTSSAQAFPPLPSEMALLESLTPSWLGVRFKPPGQAVRRNRSLPVGAALLESVDPASPASEAGLQTGDLILGPQGQPFDSPQQMREWIMTSPRTVDVALLAMRPGREGAADQEFEVTLRLRTRAVDPAELVEPPAVDENLPATPVSGLTPLGPAGLPNLAGRAHALFFWATWCGPCKTAVPEVMAFAAARGLPVLAISDEELETVAEFVQKQKAPFFNWLAVDLQRTSFVAYKVRATPTLILVDAAGVVRHRHVGYRTDKGLQIEGWKWVRR